MQLGIAPRYYTSYNNNNSQSQQVESMNFGAAKDVNLYYIMRRRSHLLPKRIFDEVSKVVEEGSEGGLETLKELHTRVYKPLMDAKTLDEAKSKYTEFEGVLDFTTIARRFSRSAKVISEQMPLDEFSLDCLKKIWSGMPQEDITKSYGFSSRTVLVKICNALHIPKPSGNYLVLLKNSDEIANQKTAEATRRHLDICRKNLALANIANKTPEAREKHALAMRQFYNDHPERRQEISLISKRTWDKCPEIRDAKAKYFLTLAPYQKAVLKKQSAGLPLTAQDRRVIGAVHKGFWDKYPEFKTIYSQARREAAREVKGGNVDCII